MIGWRLTAKPAASSPDSDRLQGEHLWFNALDPYLARHPRNADYSSARQRTISDRSQAVRKVKGVSSSAVSRR